MMLLPWGLEAGKGHMTSERYPKSGARGEPDLQYVLGNVRTQAGQTGESF